MKSALISIFVTLLLVSCTKNTTNPVEDKKTTEESDNTQGIFTDVSVLGQGLNGYLQIGDFAPDFLINKGKAGEFSLSDLKGKVVYLEFWRTRCHICVQSMPNLVSATNSIKDKDFVVIAISTDKLENISLSAVSKFIDDFNMDNWINIYDGNTLSTSITNHYSIFGTPTSYLLDRQGRVALKLHPDDSDFAEKVKAELAK
ncbi:redoxin domain-containing protein [bacterium]|nr:MAG: redoxin domain-containing protein [bacterium]